MMSWYVRRALLALTLLLVVAGAVHAQPLPTAKPEEVGLSPSGSSASPR